MARSAKKKRSVYVCQSCGHQEPKWLGRCPTCSAWSSMVEELMTPVSASRTAPASRGGGTAVRLGDLDTSDESRVSTQIPELDRVLGGGLVSGALVLVGEIPVLGSPRFSSRAMGALAQGGQRVLYMTAEESSRQVKLRADRLGINSDDLYLLADTSLDAFDAARKEINPGVCVIDSVQTVGVDELDSSIGSVGQIRAVTQRLMGIAKAEGIATFVVGHVTKEGTIAGPRVMEHMVDTVLYFEGERTGPYRILRAHKNRFGSAQEIGVFEMQSDGLRAVTNPSELFLSQRARGPGAVVVTSVEGSRPLLLEVQALATPSPYGTPRRTSLGFDPQRVAMLSAVLSARAGLELGGLDLYINVAGGVRVQEPAADLGVAVSLASAVSDKAVPEDVVVVGEVGLSGEIRGVSNLSARVSEAASLGFERCVVPTVDLDRWQGPEPELPLVGVATLGEALDALDLLRVRPD